MVNLKYLKKRRKELKLPLREMASTLGFEKASTYYKYENGHLKFKAEHIPALVNKLQIGLGDIFLQ